MLRLDELNAIRFVRAIVDVSGFTSGSSAKINASVVAYDADGNRVQVEIDPTTIEATVKEKIQRLGAINYGKIFWY